MPLRLAIPLIVLAAALSAALTKFYWPSTVNKTEYQDREVVKNRIVTVTKEVTRPDGTKETTSTTTDNSTSVKDKEITKLAKERPNWLFTVGVSKSAIDRPEHYILGVQKRLVGPFFGGLTVSTERSIGATLTMEF